MAQVLSQYVSDLTNLIQAPTSPIPLLTSALLQRSINQARGQIAVSGDCVPGYGSLPVSNATLFYSFSQITFEFPTGIKGAIAIETINYNTPQGGQLPVNPIEWARYNRYELGHSVFVRTPPRVWTQFGEGDQGTLWVNPLDAPYTLQVKTRCIPVDLVDDQTPDAIPYQWSDAVVFLAAWYAYMSLQRQADADHMLQRFQQMMQIARGASIPDTMPFVFNGAPDPFMAGRMGMSGGGGMQGRAQPRQSNPPTAA